jgi:ACS family tartrate transporter-like MFS transporter
MSDLRDDSPDEPRSMPPSALERARKKAYVRIVPLVFIAYVIAYVDRANVSFAKLTMAKDLGFDNAVFGTGAGIFFLGYFLLEIPGSLIVERWSARKWISRIMISWGLMAALTAAVTTPFQFYSVRLLLGLAEAGFFPGVIVYFTHWFPRADRARALSYFLIAAPIAQMISPKLSNPILKIGTDEVVGGVTIHHPELWGLEGWQWVYMLWGIPAVVLGFVVLFAMTDRPSQARWLTDEEREALEAELARERAELGDGGHTPVWKALTNPRVLLLALAYFCMVTANYGIEFFLPTILRDWYDLSTDVISTLLIPPYFALMLGILVIGWNSDRTKERWLHASVPLAVGAIALAMVPIFKDPSTTVLLFSLTLFSIRGFLAPFWTLPNLFLGGAGAAGSIGLINSVGNLGGFLGPHMLGRGEKATGSFEGGLWFLSGSLLVSAALIVAIGRWHRGHAR